LIWLKKNPVGPGGSVLLGFSNPFGSSSLKHLLTHCREPQPLSNWPIAKKSDQDRGPGSGMQDDRACHHQVSRGGRSQVP